MNTPYLSSLKLGRKQVGRLGFLITDEHDEEQAIIAFPQCCQEHATIGVQDKA